MSNFDYEILAAEKPDGVTLEQAKASITELYPDHHVVVEDNGAEFVATLARKSKVSRTVVAADDDALDLLDDAPPAPDKGGDDDDAPDFPKKKEDSGDDEDKKDDSEDKKDGGDEDGDGDKDPVAAVLEALKTLEKSLPKIKDQLSGLGDIVDAPIPDEALGPMPHGPGGLGGPGGPGGPGGLGGPKGPGAVGPTPGAPPGAAGVPPAARPPRGPDMRKKPPVGVPTFSKRKNKVVFRPVANDDGSQVTLAEAIAEITSHPKYAAYDVAEIKVVENEYKAHLKLREE